MTEAAINQLIIGFWPLWLVLIGVVALKFFVEIILPDLIKDYRLRRKWKDGEKWRDGRDQLQWLRGMQPKEFEEYVAELFRKLGYEAEAVGRSHDGGIDVIIKKDGVTGYVQCKKYISSVVPVGAVRDFYGALADRLSTGKGYFVTTNIFTLEAEKFAEGKPIELIDGNRLLEYINLPKRNG